MTRAGTGLFGKRSSFQNEWTSLWRISRVLQEDNGSPKIQLRPTLVHEHVGTKPVNRMTAIRTSTLK
jgi:hypothetical protein